MYFKEIILNFFKLKYGRKRTIRNSFRNFLTFLFENIEPTNFFCMNIITLELDAIRELIVYTNQALGKVNLNIRHYGEKTGKNLKKTLYF